MVPTLRPAAIGRRVGAYLIDGGVAFVILFAAASAFAGISVTTEGAFPLAVAGLCAYAVLGAWLVVYTLMQGGGGSLGMRALGLRLGRETDAGGAGSETAGAGASGASGSGAASAPVGFVSALVRNLIWGLGGAIVVGMFSPLFDASPWRRGWHDRVSRTVMADVTGRGAVAPPLASRVGASGAHVGAPGAHVTTSEISSSADPNPARRSENAQISEDMDAAGTPGWPPSAHGPAIPNVLPPAPILPVAEDTELARWSGAPVAPARTPVQTAGLISFVPGISDPALLDAPPAESAPGIPVVDAPSAAPVAPPAPAHSTPATPAPSAAPATPATPAPVMPPAPPASVPALDDPLEQTRLSTGERPVARLVWDDGTRQALYGRTLFGRNPAPETGAMVSPVRDETLSLSKTHFELVPDGSGTAADAGGPGGSGAVGGSGTERALWVIDRHSTNGVVIRRGAQRQTVSPGERTRVRGGDVLEFGDRHVTVEVAP
ncbi:MAG: hypothetical protein DI566_12345 [Microbacterium sp.]|nr:MAG: hypothetical protein DI566_12345 [Microbacterium sp.]